MVPVHSNVEEAAGAESITALPAAGTAEESASKAAAVAVPCRKAQPDPSEEDHNFYHFVGSPTSVVDLFDLCNKSNWQRQCSASGSIAPLASVAEDGCVQTGSDAQCMELSNVSAGYQLLTTNGDRMDCLTDDLVLNIMDFLDVKSAVLVFGPTSRRIRMLSRYSSPTYISLERPPSLRLSPEQHILHILACPLHPQSHSRTALARPQARQGSGNPGPGPCDSARAAARLREMRHKKNQDGASAARAPPPHPPRPTRPPRRRPRRAQMPAVPTASLSSRHGRPSPFA